MELIPAASRDSAHKLLEWVHENKTLLVLLLIGGIGFFGLLAGIHLWKNSRDEKNVTELLAMAESARKDFDSGAWESCLARYDALYQKSGKPFFKVLALHGKGSCLIGKKEYRAAAEVFERAAKEPGHVDPLYSRLEAARSYRLAEDPGALEKLEALAKEEKISARIKKEVEEEIAWFRSGKKDNGQRTTDKGQKAGE